MTGVTVPPLWAKPSEAMKKKEEHVYTCKVKIRKGLRVEEKFLEKGWKRLKKLGKSWKIIHKKCYKLSE